MPRSEHQAPGSGKALQLSGPMTLYEATELRERLLVAITEHGQCDIDLETAGPWDLAGLQLLLSAVETGRRLGLTVRLHHVPRVCQDVAERAGLKDWLSGVAVSYW